MTTAYSIKAKYEQYHRTGWLVLVVTVSTFATSDELVKSGRLARLVKEFVDTIMQRLTERLLKRNCIDFDFIIERSPQSHWQVYGLIAIKPEAAKRIWRDGALCDELARDLDLVRTADECRTLRINRFLIEPVRTGLVSEAWTKYITMTRDYRAAA